MSAKRILSIVIVLIMMLSCFTVSAFGAETEQPTASSTADELPPSTSDEEPQRLLGDVDNNSSVNVKDATAVQKHLAGVVTLDEVSVIYADADRSSEVSIKDATAIQKYVAGLDNETSIGMPFVAYPETNRYYFYLPEDWLNESTAKTGNTAGIYWWDATNPCLYWPGIPAKKGDAEGVYYYDVPKDVTTIIWNNFFNGGADTSAPHYNDAAQTINIGTEYYDPGESDFYPDGTESFDGMIYVVDPDLFPWGDYNNHPLGIGEWFYYYGKGEYGTSKVRGESKILTEDTVDLSRLSLDNDPVTINRYYFYLPEEWLNESTVTTGNTAGIYWWDGTGAQDKYPGKKAEKADVEGVYYCDVPSDVWNIMWNNYFDGGEDIFAPYYPDAISCRAMNVEFYWPDESELYPDGLESFDGMIYVIDLSDYDRDDYSGKMQFGGEWYYYYGNGEYGTAPVRGDSEIFTESALNRDSFVIG